MTLERFSPGSIKRRAENMGILSRIIPAARDAALWANYEREFAKSRRNRTKPSWKSSPRNSARPMTKQLRKMQEQGKK
jgi:predicted component of type VI protein secretion system